MTTLKGMASYESTFAAHLIINRHYSTRNPPAQTRPSVACALVSRPAP
jgi:hypothetical protein